MEWLAFEIEHATMFSIAFDKKLEALGKGELQSLPRPELRPGYIHIYQVNHPLKLLYIDGMGAAKSFLGTLDTQDMVLLGYTNLKPFQDTARAQLLCLLANQWDIDGFIRMEGGFEVILCNFSSGVDYIAHPKAPDFEAPGARAYRSFLEYVRTVSMRYDGIARSRVRLDYSSMTSAYFFDTNLTNQDPSMDLPRLTYASQADLTSMREEVKSMLDRPWRDSSIDWQAVVDLIVSRYSDRLQYLRTSREIEHFFEVINSLLNINIDYSHPWNETAAREACTFHYLQSASPLTEQDQLIYAAIATVTARICSTLLQIRGLITSPPAPTIAPGDVMDVIPKAVNMTQELIDWLDWSTWKSCGQCPYDQVCFVAFFPFGTREDHFNPRCQNETELGNRAWASNNWWRYQYDGEDIAKLENSIARIFHP